MQNIRVRRRSFVDLRKILIGDYIVLVAALISLVSLFLPWFVSSIGPSHVETAFAYSAIASTVIILMFLATIFLVIYPALSPDLRVPRFPLATAPIFLLFGAVLTLLTTYELGKYACIQCAGVSRGFGVWLAWVAAIVYIVGAVIKWGSRPLRRSESG